MLGIGLWPPCRADDISRGRICGLTRDFALSPAAAVWHVTERARRIIAAMPASLDGRLVVALSSRALFDFEEENQIFEANDDRAYMQLQLQRLDRPARAGVAFSLVHKLLAFNAQQPLTEVVILSRNDPVSGMRVFRSAQHYGLAVERGVFTRGQDRKSVV